MVENYEMIEEDSLKRTTSRKWSENTATRPNNKTQMITAASSSVKFRKNTNFEYISSNSGKKPEEKELNLCRIPSFLSSEEQNIKSKNIITKQIIVIGTSQTGKKSLINSMFEEKIDELFQANELMQKY